MFLFSWSSSFFLDKMPETFIFKAFQLFKVKAESMESLFQSSASSSVSSISNGNFQSFPYHTAPAMTARADREQTRHFRKLMSLFSQPPKIPARKRNDRENEVRLIPCLCVVTKFFTLIYFASISSVNDCSINRMGNGIRNKKSPEWACILRIQKDAR